MYSNKINQFEEIAETMMPALFDPSKRQWTQDEDDRQFASYLLPNPLALDVLSQLLLLERNGIRQLYLAIPSEGTTYQHRLCAYVRPYDMDMIKFNAVTGSDGLCSEIFVTFYSSLEDMRADLIAEVRRVENEGFARVERLSDTEIICDFII